MDISGDDTASGTNELKAMSSYLWALLDVNKLVNRGVEEIVFVPLLLSDAFPVQADVPALLAQVRASFPKLHVIASRPIGPEAQLRCAE